MRKLESSGGGEWQWLALGGARLERAMRWRQIAWMCERDAGAARRAVHGKTRWLAGRAEEKLARGRASELR
jgi:hypothetical protein